MLNDIGVGLPTIEILTVRIVTVSLLKDAGRCVMTPPGLAGLPHLRLIISTSLLGSHMPKTARTPGRFHNGTRGSKIKDI